MIPTLTMGMDNILLVLLQRQSPCPHVMARLAEIPKPQRYKYCIQSAQCSKIISGGNLFHSLPERVVHKWA